MTGWSIALIGLGTATLVTPVAIVTAKRLGIVDRPGALKPQHQPVPYLGGIAVFTGLIVGAVAGRPSVLLPLAAALGLGLADDVTELPAGLRLIGQLGVGALVVVTLPLHLPGALGAVAVVVVTPLVINGVNLIDGLDMLASGVVAAAAAGFAVVLHGAGRQLSIALCAALVGFLLYNRPPARIYLGDAGSYLLGASLAVLLAYSWAPGVPPAVGTAALALVAVVVAEVAFAAVRRLRGRRSPMTGDRRHPYDQLVARGWPRSAASLTYVGIEALLAVGVVVAAHLTSMTAAVVVDVVAAAGLTAGAAATGALSPDEEART
jgi:UDP-GlcNAc:undecaprenyl-phosphate/decaprenyl-phosphate GlcNAc-1-phosphate transferase